MELRAAEEAVIAAARHLDFALDNQVRTFNARKLLGEALKDLDEAEAEVEARGAS